VSAFHAVYLEDLISLTRHDEISGGFAFQGFVAVETLFFTIVRTETNS
jgi:hypothetical protein